MPRHASLYSADDYDDGYYDDDYDDEDDDYYDEEDEYGGGGGGARGGSSSSSQPAALKSSKSSKPQQPPPPVPFVPKKKKASQQQASANQSNAAAAAKQPAVPTTPATPAPHILFFGHVDAGKSTLVGRLMHATQAVTDADAARTLRDAKSAGKASFSWAWLVDETPQERARGVTEAVAMRATPATSALAGAVLLDAPGHRDFQPNVFSAMALCDAGIFVVDASGKHASKPLNEAEVFDAEGHYDGAAASLEYLALWAHLHANVWHSQHAAANGSEQLPDIASLRINGGGGSGSGRGARLVVVVTKMDAIGWDRERFDAVCACTRDRIDAAVRHIAPETQLNVTFVPVAATAQPGEGNVGGVGDDAAQLTSQASWVASESYPTLVDSVRQLAASCADDRLAHVEATQAVPWRFVVADADGATAKDATVYGRLVAGRIAAGSPQTLPAISTGLGICRSVVVDRARRLDDAPIVAIDGGGGSCALVAGEAARLRLQPEKKKGKGSSSGENYDSPLARAGCVLSGPPGSPAPVVAIRFRARLLVFRTSKPLLPGTAGEMLVHASRCEARVISFEQLHGNYALGSASTTVPRRAPRVLRAGDDATVLMEVSDGVVVEPFATCRALGAFGFAGVMALGQVVEVIDTKNL